MRTILDTDYEAMQAEILRLRAALKEIARFGVDMHHDFSRSAMQSKIAREALMP